MRDYEEAVQDMKPLDAVEYLLGVIEALVPSHDAAAELKAQYPILTPSEAAILAHLVSRPDRVIPLSELVTAVRPPYAWEDDERKAGMSIKVQLCRLRRKLEQIGAPGRITTVYSKGYVWQPEAAGVAWPSGSHAHGQFRDPDSPTGPSASAAHPYHFGNHGEVCDADAAG